MIAGIVEARMDSTRLPGKVLMTLADNLPLIWHIINRVKKVKLIDKIVIATTENSSDDILVEWANMFGIDVFRGSTNNVLERYHDTAKFYKADIIVRITADDPFKDPDVIEEVIKLLQDKSLDFAYNNNPPSFPEGLDTEVFTMNALEIAYMNSIDPFELEHVTQHFYRNPSVFRQANFESSVNLSFHRWTVDTKNDFNFAKNVYTNIYSEHTVFSYKDVLDFLERNPEITKINCNEKRSIMYDKE